MPRYNVYGKAVVVERRTDWFQWSVEADSKEEAIARIKANEYTDILNCDVHQQHETNIEEYLEDDWEVELA